MGFLASLLLEYTVETGSIILKSEASKGFPLWKQLKFYATTKLILRGKKIRISFAYLFKIKIHDCYFLVKSSRLHYYQPAGGVYKFLSDRNFRRFQDWGIDIDNSLSVDDDSENDLRLKVPSENLLAFFEWFLSKQDRETNPVREFKEELLDKGILSQKFAQPNFNFLWQVRYPIKWSEHFQCYEFFIHDVFELITTPEQEQELKTLLRSGNTDEYIWADADCINRRGYDSKTKQTPFHISPHTDAITSSQFKSH